MNYLRRVINIPEKLQSFVTGFFIYLMVQAEIWFFSVTGIDATGVFKPLGIALAVILAFLVKAFLEKIIPERFHSLVNTILVWLASFVAANAFFK